MLRGTCDRCQRTYRLPEGRRGGRCPRCGVRLSVEEAETRGAEKTPCPHCGHEAWSTDASCPGCGSMMVRNGACYKCLNCGATSGCS